MFSMSCLNTNYVFLDVVHKKTSCSQKEFENAASEWLRHAKQRRLREK